MPQLGPRVVIAGTHSGVGKTTVASGLMAALCAAGHRVASAKVGPDFIDPGYHALATGRPGRNLDAWMCDESVVAALGVPDESADVLIVEGVMGLFDGSAEAGPPDRPAWASTAHVAWLLDAPVVLVVDASAQSGSVAALVHGFATFDDRVNVAGVVLNRVGSDGHERMLREALDPVGVPVIGVLRRDDSLVWRDRHLGLVPVVEERDAIAEALARVAGTLADGCDLDALMALANSAPATEVNDVPRARPQGHVRIAVATGPAFSFSYPENLRLLAEAGAELVEFDPLVDAALPVGVDGLIAGGGFPEIYAANLSANAPLLFDVRDRIAEGLVVWAECGGLLWLADSLDGQPLTGAVAAQGRMTDKLTLGYRRATTLAETPLGPAGTELRGHEFHYSVLEPPGDALDLVGRLGSGRAGHATPTLLASYLHVHLASNPALAERFVATAVRRAPQTAAFTAHPLTPR